MITAIKDPVFGCPDAGTEPTNHPGKPDTQSGAVLRVGLESSEQLAGWPIWLPQVAAERCASSSTLVMWIVVTAPSTVASNP